jgi:hypothetical protein
MARLITRLAQCFSDPVSDPEDTKGEVIELDLQLSDHSICGCRWAMVISSYASAGSRSKIIFQMYTVSDICPLMIVHVNAG